MPNDTVSVEVTQADREAATAALTHPDHVMLQNCFYCAKQHGSAHYNAHCGPEYAKRLSKLSEAFARHRLAALSPRPVSTGEEVERLREAQEIIGGLLDCGFQAGLVERARTWLTQIEAMPISVLPAALSSDRPSPVEGE